MPRGKSDAVTVSDIAARASVSIGTASKALNGAGQLRATTRERVIAAAVELGYSSRLLPVTEFRQRSYTVGVLTTDSIGRFTLPIITGAEDALGMGQMSMLLCESRGDPIREQHYLRVLLARRVDGIIVTGRSSDKRPSLGRYPVPVVYALVESDDESDLSILSDEEGAGAAAATHLLNVGKSRLVHVTGSPAHSGVMKRMAGIRRAVRSAGLELAAEPLHGEWTERWGREAVLQLHRSGVEFDGAICGNDQIARGFSDALRESGVAVPAQVGVAGIDNWDVMVQGSRPELSTVDLNLAEIGRLAATMLLESISEGALVRHGGIVVPSRMIARASTG